MQNVPVASAGAVSGGVQALSPAMIDTLAVHGLRRLAHAPIANVARALAHFDREQLGIAIEVMVAMLDASDGDPEAEDATDLEDDFALSPMARRFTSGPGCEVSDSDGDQAYSEWHTLPAATRRAGTVNSKALQDCAWLAEDAEDDDADHGLDEGEPNFARRNVSDGPGCNISDPDYAVDDQYCDEDHDMEREQMPNDVPMLPVYSLEHNPFTDERTPLGISNLTTSFVGQNVRSADTGAIHSSGEWRRKPGDPV